MLECSTSIENVRPSTGNGAHVSIQEIWPFYQWPWTLASWDYNGVSIIYFYHFNTDYAYIVSVPPILIQSIHICSVIYNQIDQKIWHWKNNI